MPSHVKISMFFQGDTPGGLDNGNWNSTRSMPLVVDVNGVESRDDEVAALPFPLCSDAGAPSRAPRSRMTTRGGIEFIRPDCNDPTTFTRINGIRIINARRLNSNQAPTIGAGSGADGVVSTAGDNTIADAERIPGNGTGANSFTSIYSAPPCLQSRLVACRPASPWSPTSPCISWVTRTSPQTPSRRPTLPGPTGSPSWSVATSCIPSRMPGTTNGRVGPSAMAGTMTPIEIRIGPRPSRGTTSSCCLAGARQRGQPAVAAFTIFLASSKTGGAATGSAAPSPTAARPSSWAA